MLKIIPSVFLVMIIIPQDVLAQHQGFKINDSLKSKSIPYLTKRLEKNNLNDTSALVYANTLLYQSKIAGDPEHLFRAYHLLMHKSKKEVWLQYCDSMLGVAADSRQNDLIGSAYLTRGLVHNSIKQPSKALDDLLMADNFISRTDDQYLIHKTKFSLAQFKYQLGYYYEAISLLKECKDYFKENEPGLPYLRTLYNLSLCYIKTKQYAVARAEYETGYRESVDADEARAIPYFMNAEGRNDFFKENYHSAITKLQQSLPQISSNEDYITASVSNFYIGRSYWALGDYENALPYFKKVDELFTNDNFITGEVLEAYVLLAQYYEQKNETGQRINYLMALLKAEAFVQKNFRYLSENMHREYDLKKIKDSIAELKKSIFYRSKLEVIFGILFLMMCGILGFIFYKHRRSVRIRRLKFKGFIKHTDRAAAPQRRPAKIVDGDLVIKPEIVESVVKKLQKFEESQAFLDKNFNLSKMAAAVDCNTRYTSRIIFETRNKKYIDYIDDLRIDFIITRLKTDNKYRNYTIKALTDEAGFKSPQKFKEAFHKTTELNPICFIKELTKHIQSEKSKI